MQQTRGMRSERILSDINFKITVRIHVQSRFNCSHIRIDCLKIDESLLEVLRGLFQMTIRYVEQQVRAVYSSSSILINAHVTFVLSRIKFDRGPFLVTFFIAPLFK